MAESNDDCNCSIGGMRGISFDYRGQKISPADAFDIVYSPFDELVNLNREVVSKRDSITAKMRARDYSYLGHEISDADLSSLSGKARENSFNNSKGLVAMVTFDNGRREKFTISPRTNYDPTQLKRPNIVYLQCPNLSKTFILREERDYTGDALPEKKMKAAYSPNFKGNIFMQDGKSSPKASDIYFVPEPSLTLALEQLRLSGIGRRITPKVRWLGYKGGKSWIVRDLLPSINDAPVREEDLGSYFGTLNGLGLMDFADCNPDHYCRQGVAVVNIDPDFVCYSSSDGSINHSWGKIKHELFESNNSEDRLKVALNPRKVGNARIEAIEDIKKQLGGKSLVDFLPKNPSDANVINYIGLDSTI